MRYVTLDFETYWRSADYTLSKLGPIEYIRDERFYAQLMSYRIDEGETQVVEHDVIPHALASLNLTDPNVAVIAHNGSGFDFMILSERYGIHPANMYDTICMARWCGVARFTRESHAALTDWFGHGIKQAGTVVSDGKKTREEFTPEEWEFFKQYCKDDTTQCSENFFAMLPYVPEDALKFMSLTAKMATEPAFRLNTLALRDYINELSDKEEEARKAIAYMFHFPTTETMLKAIRSPLKFCDMLRSLGVEPPMKYSETQTATAVKKMKERRDAITALFKESDGGRTLEPAMRQQLMIEFAEIAKKLGGDEDDLKVYTPALSKQDLPFLALRDHPDLRVQQLVNMRLEHNSSILMSRAKTFYKLANQSPRPLPILLKTFYAHTSRYGAGNSEGASDKTGIQNISKRNPNTLQIRKSIHAPRGYVVVACDSSQIEARMLAYIAQEQELLKHFREGGDPYAELAEKIFSVPAHEIHEGAKSGDKKLKMYRNVGKTCVLSCLEGSTLVLTNTGWKPISKVLVTDNLWDGEQWVQHQGRIWNGWRRVVRLDGVTLTPDHLIWNGSSWKAAAEYQLEPESLRLAQSIAASALRTCGLSRMRMAITRLSTRPSVRTVVRCSGIVSTRLIKVLKTIAGVATRFIQTRLLGSVLSSVGFQTLNPALSLGSLQWSEHIPHQAILPASADSWSGWWKSTVPVARQDTLSNSIISCLARLLGAMNAPSVKQLRHSRSCIGSTKTFVQTRSTGVGCSTVLPLASSGAPILTTTGGLTTEAEESLWTSPIGEVSSHICSRFRDGITPLLKSTALTMRKATRRVICILYLVTKTQGTSVVTQICRRVALSLPKRTRSFANVYDILNSGPNNRFTIWAGHGPLIVHNCGYGVGKQKYADTLLHSGIRLAEDVDKHNELAYHAHMVYRLSNPGIVALWKRCQSVCEHMARMTDTQQFTFGGPKDDVFTYGLCGIPGTGKTAHRVQMPSGYNIWYPDLSIEQSETSKWECLYSRIRGKTVQRMKLYSGSLTENCIQSLAFQLLMWQACRMEECGIKLHCNIHDSFATVVPEKQAEAVKRAMELCMSAVPPWLPGFPVACEAEIGTDFTIV